MALTNILQGLHCRLSSLSGYLSVRLAAHGTISFGRRNTRGAHVRTLASSSASASASAESALRKFGLTKEDMEVIEQKNPGALRSNVETVVPKVKYLNAYLDQKQLAAVLRAQPRILSRSLEEHIRPTVQYLRGIIGPRAKRRLSVILEQRPVLLTYDVEENLAPKVKWLEELGLQRDQLKSVLARAPDILSIGIATDLQPTVNYLKSLQMSDVEVAHKVFKSPGLFHNHLSVLRNNVKKLQDAGVPPPVLKQAVLESRELFRQEMSRPPMQGKWKIAEEVLGGVAAALASAPHYFDHSIDTIAPRAKWLKARGEVSKLGEVLMMEGRDYLTMRREVEESSKP